MPGKKKSTKKKATMKKNPKKISYPRVASFGQCTVKRIRPDKNLPRGINVIIEFREALELKLALEDILLHLNKEDQRHKLKDIRISIFTDQKKIQVFLD